MPLSELYKDALAWARRRKVVLADEYYDKFVDIARQKAATVSGISSLRQLQAVIESLSEAVATGATFKDWVEGLSGEAAQLPASRVETVFRTNVQSSYMAGIARQQARNTVNRPYFLYDAINDSRTRPAHAAMDGHIARYDDPWWRGRTPPNGFNCRCSRIALTSEQARARGYGTQPTPQAQPDPGFDSSPLDDDGMSAIRQSEARALQSSNAKLRAAYLTRRN